MAAKPNLKLLYGGKTKHVPINGVKVSVAPVTLHPLPVDVKVFEEDTRLILTVDPVMRYSEEHPVRLMTDVLDDKANPPGTVVVNNNSWYAVVHDLDAEPSCRRQWVAGAYSEILRQAEERQVERIGLPLLGSVHGNMKAAASLDLLLDAMRSGRRRELRFIMILIPPSQVRSIKKALIKSAR